MSPPKKTLRVGPAGAAEATDQEAQSVRLRSKSPRLAWCWEGRQEMVAVMEGSGRALCGSEVEVAVAVVVGFSAGAERGMVRSRCSHQSSSVTWVAGIWRLGKSGLFPRGTKKWVWGYCLKILVRVAVSRWS